MDSHLSYEHSRDGCHTGNSRNGSFPKKIKTEHGQNVIHIPRDRNSAFNPTVIPKHESRGLSIEEFIISLYTKGMNISDIEDKLRDIYEISLSSSAISIITNKVMQAATSGRIDLWSSFIWWSGGRVFKARESKR